MKLATTTLLATLWLSAHAPAADVDVRQAAGQVDALIEKNYATTGVKPNPLTDDATFLRRAYLDIAGRIPTAAEARKFASSMEPSKRADLIDQLLDSEGYVSHQSNYWADVLRITTRLPGQDPQNGAAYIGWVRDAIRNNLPYDEFAKSLITAEGMIDENGAVGFYLRDRGMPLDHLATTVQVFLGTQMVCAQCHDHPFDEWTQMDYYKLAAFSSPMDVVRNPSSVTRTIGMVNKQAREKQQALEKERQQARREKKNRDVAKDSKQSRTISTEAKEITRNLSQLSYNFRNSVVGETDKILKLPHDYQYDDAKPEQVINPLTPFGEKITVAEGESRVQAYGKWMTSPENPRFTKTIANRLWKRVMGVGLIEPVDNLRDDSEASNPALLAYLEKLLVDLDYDLKAYYRVLYNSKTYQREASSADLLATYYFPGPRLRRMSAEQVWDSIVALIRPDLDTATDPRAPGYASDSTRLEAWKRIDSQSPEALLKRQEELAAFTKSSNQRLEQLRDQVEKAIAGRDAKRASALAGELVKFNQDATAEYARLTYWDLSSSSNRYFQAPFRNVPNTLFRSLRTAFPGAELPNEKAFRLVANNATMMEEKGAKDAQEMKRRRKEMDKAAYAKFERERNSSKRLKGFVRASEISSPAPDGHFLRAFGQSDRQLIENADDQASVPQTLALMNGQLFTAIGDPYSVIVQEATAASDDDTAIDAVFISMLARKPTDQERSLVRGEFDDSQNRLEAIRGVIWTVLNTQQFLFIE